MTDSSVKPTVDYHDGDQSSSAEDEEPFESITKVFDSDEDPTATELFSKDDQQQAPEIEVPASTVINPSSPPPVTEEIKQSDFLGHYGDVQLKTNGERRSVQISDGNRNHTRRRLAGVIRKKVAN